MLNVLITRRLAIALIVLLLSGILALSVPRITPDSTLLSAIDVQSEDYVSYHRFVEAFGSQQFILVAIVPKESAVSPRILKALEAATTEIQSLEDVSQTVSLANFRFFQEKNGGFGTFRLVDEHQGGMRLVSVKVLDVARKAIPFFDYLLSPNMRALGIIVRIEEHRVFDPATIARLKKGIGNALSRHMPTDTGFRMVGIPVLREAVQRYNVQTAITFGLLCSLVIAVVLVYLFKSLRVVLISFLVLGLCVLWTTGLISLLDIRLNSATSLSFGLVLVITVATITHLASQYIRSLQMTGNTDTAIRESLHVVGGPCLMCTLTTAAGFACIMVTSVPMVFQFGLIMSLGVLVSFVLAMCLTPLLLTIMTPLDTKAFDRMSSDLPARVLERLKRLSLESPKSCVVATILLTGLLVSGVPRIDSDMQLSRMFSASTKEAQDSMFVGKHLAASNSVEVVVEGEEGLFRDLQAWKAIGLIESRLRQIPGVASTESLLPVLEYLQAVVGGSSERVQEVSPHHQEALGEIFGLLSLSGQGAELRRRYVNESYSLARICVRLAEETSRTVSEIISDVRAGATSGSESMGKATVTGYTALFDGLSSRFLRAQLVSVGLVVAVITILLIAQFRSVTLGLLGLIPNLFPIAVIFGIMGWFEVNLDSVTFFAASVSMGLAADNTIHYVTHFLRELKSGHSGSEEHFRQALRKAYSKASRAMFSTSTSLALGFTLLVLSPFRPVASFGALGSCAILSALWGDLVLLPSIILASSFVRSKIWRDQVTQAV